MRRDGPRGRPHGATSGAEYRQRSARQRAGYNRDLDIVDEKERHPERSLTSIFKARHRDPRAFKRNIPTRRVGARLQLAPPHERRLYRGPIRMLADIDGRPHVVQVTPSNDAQWRAIQGHDKAVFAAVTKEDDSGLRRFSHRVVVDAATGQRFRFYVDGDGIRDAADTGEVELQGPLLLRRSPPRSRRPARSGGRWVSRSPDRTCPVPGSPCLRVLDDVRAELARVQAREDDRPSLPCQTCPERNRIALGGSTCCYRCKSGNAVEGDHVRGSGSGPSILRGDANLNRIAMEGERIWRSVGRDDLCPPCIYGYGLRIGIQLGRMEVDL